MSQASHSGSEEEERESQDSVHDSFIDDDSVSDGEIHPGQIFAPLRILSQGSDDDLIAQSVVSVSPSHVDDENVCEDENVNVVNLPTAKRKVEKNNILPTANRKNEKVNILPSEKKNIKRDKRSQHFFLTFHIPDEWNDVRDDVFLLFESMCERYVIAREKSDSLENVFGHVHFYFKTYGKYLLNELRSFIIENLLGSDVSFDIQACKSPKSVIKYITKEDLKVKFNVRVSELHFNFRVHHWCVNNDYFEYDSPFVTEHKNCYRFLLSYFNEHKIKKDFVGFKNVENRVNAPVWVNACIDWWNEFIVTSGVRRKQLYLWGETSLGKSTIIEDILGELMPFVYFPDVGKFFMHGYKQSVHKVILFEEFAMQDHCESMLKRLTEGRRYAYPQKCGEAIVMAYTGPVIFVSNECPNYFSDPFKNRLKIVKADVQSWKVSSLWQNQIQKNVRL